MELDMMKWMAAAAALAALVGGLYMFVPLQTFNLLVPKDAGSRRLAQDVRYGPDPRHTLDVYAPTTGTGPWPVVVFVHGGSWKEGNKNPYAFAGRALAAQGFVTLVANYRLHPGHPFPAFVEDAARALDWATRNAARFGGDEHTVFAMGHSAGAYNLALAVLDRRYLQALGTDIKSIKGVVSLAGPFDFVPLDTEVTRDTFGHVANLAATQPVTFARGDAPPFLLLHGSADTTVMPRNAISLDAKLRAAGGRSTLVFYQGVSHVGILLSLAKPVRALSPALADATRFMKDNAR